MKKHVTTAVTLALCLALSACSGAGAVKTGLGHVVTLSDSSKDSQVSNQVNATFCAASFDSKGKVISVSIDVAQVSAKYDDSMTLAGTGPQKTKLDQKGDYGMKKNSKIGKEWYEQVEDLEKWMKGKTADEIINMKTKQGEDANHPNVPDVADLTSSVTIDVGDFLKAFENAWTNAK